MRSLFIFLLYYSSFYSYGYHIFEHDCMGTKFIIKIDEDNKQKAKKGAIAAFEEADRLNLILSDYEDSSELSLFSKSSSTGEKFKLSKDLYTILTHGQKLANETKGDFDMTVGPLSRLWRIARFRKRIPPQEKLTAAMERVGYNHLKLLPEERAGRLGVNGMILDLGGIAKGFAADRMLCNLKNAGLRRCLIDAGGDLVIGDPPRDRKGWRIRIGGNQHPDLPVLNVSNQAVATSGDLEQFVLIGDEKFSHLINPATGLGLTSRSQVTVVTSSGIEADSLASACLVLGLEKTKLLLAERPHTSAYFLHWRDKKNYLNIIKHVGRE